ncbi:MAG: cytochrome c oxidase subunit II transmembrane domain-containing protein, partial [Hyphomicrobiaceae bacterium]
MSKTSWRAMVFCAAAAVLSMVAAGAAMAGMGQPSPMQLGLQDPATIIAHEIHTLHDYINIIIIAVAAFVLILLIYVVLRFNERANPSPSKTTHNTLLEVAWTVVPVLILVAIAIPSFKLLYHEYAYPKPDLVI